jgi:hypothetical protein
MDVSQLDETPGTPPLLPRFKAFRPLNPEITKRTTKASTFKSGIRIVLQLREIHNYG